MFHIRDAQAILQSLGTFQGEHLQAKLLIEIQFIGIIANELVRNGELDYIIIRCHAEGLHIGTEFQQLYQSACGILLGSKNAFQLKSLEHGTVDSVNGAGIDMLHLLLLQQSHYTDGCTEILAVKRQHGQRLLVRSVDDKGCSNLFLQTIYPAGAHVRTYHFVPQCRKLLCQHVTIIP